MATRTKKKVTRKVAAKRTKASVAKLAPVTNVPPIGKPWGDHGIRIGEIKGRDGAPNYHLFVVCGKDGKPVLLKNQEWGEYGKEIQGADSKWDGLANTEAMLKAGNALAKKVREHGVDCYLPAIFELQVVCANNDGLFPDNWFWSSTQFSAYSARPQGFEYGGSTWSSEFSRYSAFLVRRVLIQ